MAVSRGNGDRWVDFVDLVWITPDIGYVVDRVINGREAYYVLTREFDGQVVARVGGSRVFTTQAARLFEETQALAYLKKAAKEDSQKLKEASADGQAFNEQYPALVEHLTHEVYADGAARKTSTLLVFGDDGFVKLCLNDRDQERSLWVSGASVKDALDTLELMLETGEGEWKANKAFGPKKAQKRS